MTASPAAAAIVHIPKCAGTSLRRRLETHEGVTTGPKYHDPYLMAIKAGGLSLDDPDPFAYSIDELREVGATSAVVMGHVSVKAFADAGYSSIRIVVREPRSRMLSLFDHYQRLDGVPQAEGTRSDAFLSFLNSEFTKTQGNNFLYRMIAGAQIEQEEYDELADVLRLNSAISTLDAKLDRVGSVIVGAYWDRDVAALYSEVAAERFPELSIARTNELPRENVGPEFSETEVLSHEALARMADLIALDELALDALIDRGLLQDRSADDLDRDFEVTARRHGFTLN